MRRDDTSFHYVYIIAHVRDGVLQSPIKVGITKALKSRLATIQTGSAHKVDVAYAFVFPARLWAAVIEEEFHDEASEHRLSGEWFDMSPLRALWLLTDIVKDFAQAGSEEDGSDEFRSALYQNSGLKEAMSFVTAMIQQNGAPEQ